MTQQTAEETKLLFDVIVETIERQVAEINIALPGIVVSYNSETNLAVIQPSLQRKYVSEESSVNLPTISNVPIWRPSGANSHLRIPTSPGDEGQMIFNQRSIDLWLERGGVVDPLDNRKFSLSDAIFYPGGLSRGKAVKPLGAASSAELVNGKAFFEALVSGKIKLGNDEEELLALFDETLEELSIATTNTIFGPLQLNNFQKFIDLKERLAKIKG